MAPTYSVEKRLLESPYPFFLYIPGTKKKRPLICITPLLGQLAFFEDLHFERQFARYFAKNGFVVCLPERPIFEFHPGRGLDQIENYLKEQLTRSRACFETALLNSHVDASQAGTFGISFGAVLNCLWAQEEPRFKAHIFALAGGNLPELFMTSRDPLMKSYRKAAEKKTGLKGHALREKLREELTLEPLKEASKINPSSVLMVLAFFDRVVKYSCGLELQRALGKPKTILLPLGHYLSVLAIPLLKKTALAFFQKKLREPVQPS